MVREPNELATDVRTAAMSAAILTILELLPAGMDLTFYRDDEGEPCRMEVLYPDGQVDLYVAGADGIPTIREVV